MWYGIQAGIVSLLNVKSLKNTNFEFNLKPNGWFSFTQRAKPGYLLYQCTFINFNMKYPDNQNSYNKAIVSPTVNEYIIILWEIESYVSVSLQVIGIIQWFLDFLWETTPILIEKA